MGFLDKLKSFGKKAAKGALTMAARDYGMVRSGAHKMCKLSTTSGFDKLHFIKLTEIEATYDMKEDIKTFSFTSFNVSEHNYVMKICFNNGESCEVVLKHNKDAGSALPTAEQRIAEQYKDMADLIENMTKRIAIDEETKNNVNVIMAFGKRESF